MIPNTRDGGISNIMAGINFLLIRDQLYMVAGIKKNRDQDQLYMVAGIKKTRDQGSKPHQPILQYRIKDAILVHRKSGFDVLSRLSASGQGRIEFILKHRRIGPFNNSTQDQGIRRASRAHLFWEGVNLWFPGHENSYFHVSILSTPTKLIKNIVLGGIFQLKEGTPVLWSELKMKVPLYFHEKLMVFDGFC